jgi:1-acyl-sn-glycerol-3-phosphate acyltransferase
VLPPRGVRRALLPVVAVVELVLLLLTGGVAVAGLVSAVADRRARLARLAGLAGSYVTIELTALARLGAAWAMRSGRSPDWYDRANRETVRWALEAVFAVARRAVGFTVEIAGPAEMADAGAIAPPNPLSSREPLLVLARHGGLGDSLAVVWLLVRHGRRPKVVLKQVLEWDPLVDVALNRLGARFLRPGAPDRAEQMAALARGLGPDDALVVFPEGGNWTPRRRWRAIRHLVRERRRPAARAALLMRHVLPPRPAGVLACLDARPDLSVVVVAHAGLDGLTNPRAVWRALPLERPLTLRWWAATPPPDGEEARRAWLTAEWAIVDEWVDARTSG